MANIKKIVKDPMFIGASAGLLAATFWTVAWYVLDNVIAAPSIANIAKYLFLVTYPMRSLVVITRLKPASISNELVGYISLYIWYVQYGFFAGLFFKILRTRYTRKRCLIILIVAIVVVSSILSYINREWW